ncbi:MAG: uroporphyrinogen-III C-methyltransferase [Chloroflexi bacterium]|nr:uroporphyrinogen-III C-methyltransferase [Chloroflexota bacterium]
MAESGGLVSLVGAGPGDPGLLTRRGEALLRRAEVVVYDRLVAPELLGLCSPAAERIYVGKEGFGPSVSQDQITPLLVKLGQEGRRVVRLKGGDPFVFGRGGEEALALREAGVPFEIVPGVTSAIAAPACAGIPVTHRGLAASFMVATGFEDPTKPASDHDWAGLAHGADTLLFLMGVEHLEEIVSKLLEHGRPADEPAALVRRGTTPEQQTLVGTLETIAGLARERRLRPPAILVVGKVASLADQLGWLERRPLHGKRVLVTRAREQASALADRLAEQGARPLEFPSIKIQPLADPGSLDAALAELAGYAWVVFTSANGVRAAFERLERSHRDARAFGAARIAAIGPATAAGLAERGLRADLVSSGATAEAVAADLTPRVEPGQRVLLARADLAQPALAEALTAAGALVDDVVAYQTAPTMDGHDEVRRRLEAGEVDVVTFTSASTVRNLLAGLDGAQSLLARPLIACIGPVTAEAARARGLRVDLVAPTHTIDGLVDALVEALPRK